MKIAQTFSHHGLLCLLWLAAAALPAFPRPAAAQPLAVDIRKDLFDSNVITVNFVDAATVYANLSDRYAPRAARYLLEIETARRTCNRQRYEHNLRNLRALSYIAAGNLGKARGTRMRTAELANYNEAALERHRAAEVRETWAAHDLKELEKLIANMPGLPRRCFQVASGKPKDRVGTKGSREGNELNRGIEYEFAVTRSRGINVFLEGGARFGHTTFGVDPGAFVPVNETLGFGQLHAGFGLQFVYSQIGLTDFASPALAFGANFRGYFGDGATRSFDNGVVRGDVSHRANWSATGYIGFPQVLRQPPAIPFISTLVITPTVGVTYQEDTLKSVQTFGGSSNTFEKTFGRTGATVGLNFEVPAGNISYGLATGLTMLPSTTVTGTSSLGLPAHAKIDSQASLFLGARIGVNLSESGPPMGRLFDTDAFLTRP
ncbi:MAG: hypothetical protein K2Y71_21410 [Xanthobacteraceae bacterium]|nr:hypothetical protein [Xanthobacteraceae bacterium]